MTNPTTATPGGTAALPANTPLQARAIALHEKTFMPWDQAAELALSESGIGEAELDELIDEATPTIITTILDKHEVRGFARAILVHQPAASFTAYHWRCFHCAELFTDEATAAEHFGTRLYQQPACQIDIAEYRRMEETHRRHCEEDTDLHREIHRAHNDAATATRQAEERGYARGLEDAKKHPEELGLAPTSTAKPPTPAGKYDEVLTPFVALMERELHANSDKGDRPGWLRLHPGQCLLEIYWHVAKLSAAVKSLDQAGIAEHSADVANMAMMQADIAGLLAAKGASNGL